jgi:Tfp pilus assembly protein PilF
MAGDVSRVDKAGALFRAGFAAQRSGDVRRAIRFYTLSIEDRPTAEAYTFRGWAFSFLRRWDDAIADCRKAIELAPERGNAYNDLGAYLIEQGKHDEAEPWFERALAAPHYDARVYPHFNLGRVFAARGELKRAAAAYRSALRERADFGPARAALGELESRLQ